MAKCLACGNSSLFSTDIGGYRICNSCASKINYSSWKNREFQSIEDLVNQKNTALQLASNSQFSSESIKVIEDYFDVYINDGYVTIINGKAGQKLKVFSDYCIISTKESQRTPLVNMFNQFVDEDDDEDTISLISAEKKNIVKGLMQGKIIQTGLGLATSAVFNSVEKEKMKEKSEERKRKLAEKLVIKGEYRVNLRGISSVDTYSTPNTANGYLRFIPNGINVKDYYSCIYFFFNNSIPFQTKKIKQQVNNMRDLLQNRIYQLRCNNVVVANNQNISNNVASKGITNDTIETVRRFKQLFDEGIISEDEFNAKKNELLGL